MTAFPQIMIKRGVQEGSGNVIVMLPGGTGDISVWANTASQLSKNYRVLRLENLNVQFAIDSIMLSSDYSIMTEREAIGRTLDSFHVVTPIILVGHSFGALIALDFAIHHPDRVRAIILLEPPALKQQQFIAGI